MKDISHKIDCNVEKCCHNLNGKECMKNCICVKTDGNGGTCCCSFQDKDDE